MYATVTHMIARFGETQMIRLSRPEDREATTVDEVKVNTALADASGVIDGYIRGLYQVPLASPPDEIIRAACILARYDLAQGEHTDPSEEMSKGRKDVIAWLRDIAQEVVRLNVPVAVPVAQELGMGARITDRPRIFTDDTLRGM